MPSIELDAVDRRILDLLQDDCALSNQELAAKALTSAPTCLRRVKRLVDSGVVERRIAILAPDRADTGLVTGLSAVIEVTLDRQAVDLQSTFELRVAQDAAVQQMYRVASGPDFVLIVWVEDMEGYQALAQRLFTSDANVRNVKTYFVVKRLKFEPRIAVLAQKAGETTGSEAGGSGRNATNR